MDSKFKISKGGVNMDVRKCSFWSEEEKEMHNTERHQIIREELYPLARLSPKELQKEIVSFKLRHPDLFL